MSGTSSSTARSNSGGCFGRTGFVVTAPEMTPLFGKTLAAQVAQALQMTHTNQIWEFGAGSGALALQVLDALAAQGQPVQRYCIVDLSGSLRVRQRETLARFAHVVEWVSELPETLQGVVLGNEVLDAMPVKLLARVQGDWYERGVAVFTLTIGGLMYEASIGGQ